MQRVDLRQGLGWAARYGAALAAVVSALICRRAMDPVLAEDSPFMFFLVAIVVSGWLGGLGPALTATALSVLAVDYYYLEPFGSFRLESQHQIIQAVSFLVLGVMVSLIVARLNSTRQRAEQATREARESERRFRGTFENSPVGISHLDLNGQWLLFNQTFCEMVGYKHEELLHQSFWSLTHPEDVMLDIEPYARLIHGEIERYHVEKRYIHKDGRIVWVIVSRALQRGDRGEPLYTINSIVDISERKQAEQKLLQSEAHLQRVLDSLFTFMGVMTPDGVLTYANRSTLEVSGLRAEEVVGKPLSEAPWWSHSAEVRAQVCEAVARGRQGETVRFDTSALVAGGRQIIIDFALTPMRDEEGRITHLIPSAVDITERKRAEEALRESEQRLRATFDNAGVGILEADTEADRFVSANDRVCQILGYRREELLGMTVHEMTAPEDRPRSDELNKNLHNGRSDRIDYEKRYLKRDGTPLWVHVTVSPIRDAAGRWVRSIATVEDISERKRSEEALRMANERLAEADRRKDQFLAMLAHELRNPLAPIRYAVELLSGSSVDPAQLLKQREIIDRQVSHMGRLLDDLLDIARITQGKIQLKREHLDLRVVARRAMESSQGLTRERRQRLVYQAPSAALPIYGDPTRLEQVIRNLLNNAAKYTDAGGCIVMSLALEAEDEEAWFAVVRVCDTGAGIAPELLPHVFEPFMQGEQSLARSQGGLGIGLAMVESLVRMHGGRVEARSAGLGQGSEFIVRLPLAEEPSAEPQKAVRPPSAGQCVEPSPQRILVVDDNEDAVASLCELLILWGYEVHAAYDGPQALAEASRWVPDVILLDIGLPGMDGFEVARRLRRESAMAGTYIVAVTGYGSDEDRRRAHGAGFDHYLTKPVDIEKLHALL